MNELKAEHKRLLAILIGVIIITVVVIGEAFYIYNIYNHQKLVQPQIITCATPGVAH